MEIKRGDKKIIEIFSRYIIILIFGLGNFYILQKVLTPITIHLVNITLNIFTNTTLIGNTIQTGFVTIQIIPACVAISAFYLLFLLIFSTADINIQKRIEITFFAFATLLLLNVSRIIILTLISTKSYFELAHWICWYIISTIFVVAVWFAIAKIYNIKAVPVYSDMKNIKNLTKKKGRS